ncbi:MAG: hypothetical protein AAGI34_11190 [Pseudomonadota bacterium]
MAEDDPSTVQVYVNLIIAEIQEISGTPEILAWAAIAVLLVWSATKAPR